MNSNKEKIYFIGAGPGDPTLLTLKAAAILQKADAVIVDRLVSKEIITDYTNPLAYIIEVGKQGGSGNSVKQSYINELLIKTAGLYNTVVRLKGGDVTIFSNILDELEAVQNAGINYEIIPGITALSGAAAYAGLPLTARGYANGIRILTYYNNSTIADNEWKALASGNDTLVFYMSAATLPALAHQMVNAGASSGLPLVVIEQATTPAQQVHEFILNDFIQHNNFSFKSPSLVIIGRVTELYKKFAWLPNNEKPANYFNELINKAAVYAPQNIDYVSRA